MPKSWKRDQDLVELLWGQLDVLQRVGDVVGGYVALLAAFGEQLTHFFQLQQRAGLVLFVGVLQPSLLLCVVRPVVDSANALCPFAGNFLPA